MLKYDTTKTFTLKKSWQVSLKIHNHQKWKHLIITIGKIVKKSLNAVYPVNFATAKKGQYFQPIRKFPLNFGLKHDTKPKLV